MASVDDIFKNVGLPSKRKREAIPDPNEIYKSSKLSASSSHRNRSNDQPHADQSAVANDDDDLEAGPAPPPREQGDSGGHQEAEAGDDDEGRFFGGGISAQESEVLDFVAGVGEDANQGPEKIDAAWMRRTSQNLEKRIATNAQLRAKHEGEPEKFIASEAQLDADVKALSILSENPQLYPDFVALGCAVHLAGLLAHDNTDIAIDAIEIIGELTDEDVAAQESQWDALVDALLDADLVGLLVSNLARLDEADEADRSGVYHALGVVENLCSRSTIAARIGAHDDLLGWLLQRVQRKEEQSATVSQNKQYAAEILAILAQSSAQTRRQMAARDAIDVMLQLVASYRKRDPEKGSEEDEYMENLFEALTCLVDESSGKDKFLEAEGVELCLIMFKEGKRSKGPALRLMDHATSGATSESVSVCVKLVDAGGLKPLFTLFIKSRDQRFLGHILGVLASMLRLLPPGSAERIRTLAKFVEKDYEKTAKLVQLHADYGARVGRAEAQHRQETANAAERDASEMEVELLSRRLDAGLFTLQQVDVLLAWLVAEDGGARKRIQKLLADKDESLTTVATIIKEQREALDTTEEDSRDIGDMLDTLLEFLR
ncbi:hypothetical protein L249_0599 [Ophiocordyceps polyrhachis-furcata BCC 54312]|uniref:Beta-catenin-like protein 1 N-terminal domain-containing protein n=1 Tax=Ophiocordyceps polyrhachis-furcata BCC 54312 TaxID=1330021 RepID=A0A367LCP9_9HYPO|nr:hypothetical protein L249_0599 [Ophiocordyceps polyrhachis-furcata BCC 54312]